MTTLTYAQWRILSKFLRQDRRIILNRLKDARGFVEAALEAAA